MLGELELIAFQKVMNLTQVHFLWWLELHKNAIHSDSSS